MRFEDLTVMSIKISSLLGYDAIQSGRKGTILEKSGSFIYGVEPFFYPDDRGNR
ncbi:hypothetical protein B7P43_G06427 [Cryptotermes secundus]|uniref:Uncharacterized protein n=1 Tax=Cryptotermes secundus TaxID=105785 RepID=A0A2J7PJZ9_9NEOP|nr:hypothetical protein B7P43_G06427 [Cryptotermes secundus]